MSRLAATLLIGKAVTELLAAISVGASASGTSMPRRSKASRVLKP